ncbi:hypothetical protein F5141DRAFT_567748 [Pisolithus sp. B1]|nr:hypothetical protein F5141DRAFT_567748 [Pisolithus sp. B1]
MALLTRKFFFSVVMVARALSGLPQEMSWLKFEASPIISTKRMSAWQHPRLDQKYVPPRSLAFGALHRLDADWSAHCLSKNAAHSLAVVKMCGTSDTGICRRPRRGYIDNVAHPEKVRVSGGRSVYTCPAE